MRGDRFWAAESWRGTDGSRRKRGGGCGLAEAGTDDKEEEEGAQGEDQDVSDATADVQVNLFLKGHVMIFDPI